MVGTAEGSKAGERLAWEAPLSSLQWKPPQPRVPAGVPLEDPRATELGAEP